MRQLLNDVVSRFSREAALLRRNGCTQSQFCEAIDASTKIGARTCRQSDWRNDEPITSPKDCAVMKQERGLPSVCVPAQ